LKVAGVPARQLRRALLREYRSTLGVAWVVGMLAGIGGAILMLPDIPLVSVGGPLGGEVWSAWSQMVALPAAVAASVLAMVAVVLAALRMVRRASPERLREGTR